MNKQFRKIMLYPGNKTEIDEHITLAMQPFDETDYKDENGYTDYDAIAIDTRYMYEDISNILTRYDFFYFHVTIENGYYEGFSVMIENNYPVFYDGYREKQDALKEVTQLKKFLLECCNNGLVECFPGWCTGYRDHGTTVTDINTTIRDIRQEIKGIPTYKQYLTELQ